MQPTQPTVPPPAHLRQTAVAATAVAATAKGIAAIGARQPRAAKAAPCSPVPQTAVAATEPKAATVQIPAQIRLLPVPKSALFRATHKASAAIGAPAKAKTKAAFAADTPSRYTPWEDDLGRLPYGASGEERIENIKNVEKKMRLS